MSLKVCDELNFGGLSCLMDISWGKSGVVVEFYILDNGHQGRATHTFKYIHLTQKMVE